MPLPIKIVQILKKPVFWLMLFLAITGSAVAAYSTVIIVPEAQQQITDAKMTLNGDLSPFEINLEQPFYLYVGSMVPFHFTGKQLADGINLNNFITTPFNNLTSDEFHIDLLNDKLQVSASIRDSNGNPIIQIVNNAWKAVNPSYQLAYWDRNYNAYAFEVITSDYVPILQVAMVGPNEIQLDGLFYTENGFVRIAPMSNGGASFSYYPKGMSIEEANENVSIPLFFKYPTLTNASNLGKMQNPVYPTTDPLADANNKLQAGFILQIVGGLIGIVFGAIFPITLVVRNTSKKTKESRRLYSTSLKNRQHNNPYWRIHQKKSHEKKKKQED